jgi:hypothetical protein
MPLRVHTERARKFVERAQLVCILTLMPPFSVCATSEITRRSFGSIVVLDSTFTFDLMTRVMSLVARDHHLAIQPELDNCP